MVVPVKDRLCHRSYRPSSFEVWAMLIVKSMWLFNRSRLILTNLTNTVKIFRVVRAPISIIFGAIFFLRVLLSLLNRLGELFFSNRIGGLDIMRSKTSWVNVNPQSSFFRGSIKSNIFVAILMNFPQSSGMFYLTHYAVLSY